MQLRQPSDIAPCVLQHLKFKPGFIPNGWNSMGYLSNHIGFNLVPENILIFSPCTAPTTLLEQNRVFFSVFSQHLRGSHGFVLRGLPKTERWKESQQSQLWITRSSAELRLHMNLQLSVHYLCLQPASVGLLHLISELTSCASAVLYDPPYM